MNPDIPPKLFLTVDIEGEWINLPGEQSNFDVNEVVKAVVHLESLIKVIECNYKIKIPVTWFIRCDDSVASVTGKEEGLLLALDDFIRRRKVLGDEFGLHPHFYVYKDGVWQSEKNHQRQREQLYRAALAWKRYFGVSAKLSRMGEALMNNVISSSLVEIGVELDSSALVGRSRFDSGFQFDWTITPNTYYHPSTIDYRRPANMGEDSDKFIQVPFTMMPIKASYDASPIMRYCNLAYKNKIIKNVLKDLKKLDYVVMVLHPHELIEICDDHPLISHSPSALRENIESINRIFGGLNFALLSECLRVDEQDA